MDAAAIEETNKIRVSLGMAPLPVPGAAPDTSDDSGSDSESEKEPESTVESRQAQSYDNYSKLQQAEAAKKKREQKAAAVRKARENAQRLAKLDGEGLADAKDGDVDAKSWLMGQKKRQKKIDKARKLEEELAAAEAEAAAAVKYTSKDLAGIKVAHDTTNFKDGEDQVLTLKDTNIGAGDDDEEDELENFELREQEKLENRLDLKKKKPGYNPNDDDEGGGILAQYDEEINGKKQKKFTLDSIGNFGEIADILGKPVEKKEQAENVSLDDIVDNTVSSDYLAPAEIKVKKPKKSKKNRGSRKKQADEDDIFPIDTAGASGDAMQLDTAQEAPTRKRKVEDDLEDDDDLQASLAMQRRNALKKRKKQRPEDLAKQLKEQEDEQPKQEPNDGGLVIGEISEFVSGLGKADDEEDRVRKRRKPTTKSPEPYQAPVPTEDAEMADADATVVKEESPEPVASREPEEPHYEDEEKTVGTGMGAALSLLRERGLVEESKGESYETLRAREEFLAKKRLLEEELEEQTRQMRERDRRSGRLDKMSTKDREDYARQQNQWRDQQQSRRMAELFNANYVPSFNIKYKDDHGRDLNQKEAFKELSHQFHGKGSGKGKTEKKLKQIEDEKRREAQSMFDATQNGGMSNATAQQLKKRKEAGVRLG